METKPGERIIQQNVVSTCVPLENVPKSGLFDWMLMQLQTDEPVYLLAHFDDGIVWGRREQENGATSKWITSHDYFRDYSPPLRDLTLQQARVFHASGELHVWRDGDNVFYAVYATDVAITETMETAIATEYLDEPQILWGDTPEGNPINGFQLWREGSQGLYHALPVSTYRVPAQKQKQPDKQVKLPPLLKIRHYLAIDAPAARIARSRIVEFSEKTYQFEEDSEAESSLAQEKADALDNSEGTQS